MAYEAPAVRIRQTVEISTTSVATKLPAFVFGPDYRAMVYDNASTKAKIALGSYDSESSKAYAWPNKPVGGVVDTLWTSLFMDSAWLRYFTNGVSGEEVKALEAYPNRLKSSALVFATANGVTRSAALAPRNVQVGDGIRLSATVCGQNQVFDTTVSSLIADAVAASVDAMVEDEDNAATAVAGAVVTRTSGTTGTVTVTGDAAAYDGSEAGLVKETYILTVVTPGAFGTGKLAVTTVSGTDNMASVITPADGTPVSIGTRGLALTFAEVSGQVPFVAGQTWTVDVTQAWTAAEIDTASGSTYTGAKDGTYIVTVVAGGKWGDAMKVVVTSTGTLDNSGPYDVSAKGAVITLPTGVKFSLGGTSATGLVAGDRFYIQVSGAKQGAVHTIATSNSLPDWVFGVCDEDDLVVPVALTVELALVRNIEIAAARTSMVANHTSTTTSFTVNAGITAADAQWLVGGAKVALPVIKGQMYVQYRALSQDFVGTVKAVTTVDDVRDLWGAVITPDMPLAYGVYMAAKGAAGGTVRFSGTPTDDDSGYLAVLDRIYERNDVYSLVPLTKSVTVWDSIFAHALDESSELRNRWRTCWFNGFVTEKSGKIVTTDSTIPVALIQDDPDVPGSANILVTSANADFLDSGVKSSDTLRCNYSLDAATGAETYEEYVIDEVMTNEQVRLVTGPTTAVNLESRFEVWHNNTVDEMANQLVAQARRYASSRVQLVWPDKVTIGGELVDGIYLVCYLAGVRAGQAPHQGLTNWELSGFDNVDRTNLFDGRLDYLAENGVWIVTQDSTGAIYTRHQLTTDPTSVATRESSKQSNRDSLGYRFFDFFVGNRYIGRTNITPTLLAKLRADWAELVNTIRNEANLYGDLGPQLLEASLTKLQRNSTQYDIVEAEMTCDDSDPFNGFRLNMFFQAS